MANKQINELTELTTASGTDLLVVYDLNEAGSEKTKKITRDNAMPVFSAWVLVQEYNISSGDTLSETIPWDGETNDQIYINFYGYHGGNNIYIRINNDSGSNYLSGSIVQDGNTLDGGPYQYFGATDRISIIGGAAGMYQTKLYGSFKNLGEYRPINMNRTFNTSSNTDSIISTAGYTWQNTVDDVTSIYIGGGSGVVGKLSIYKWHTFGG